MSLQLFANVIVLAAIYALVSSGYVLIYRVSRVLNLAHGELMMVGAYLLVALAGLFPLNPPLALALAAICGLLMGIAVYAVLMRWMTGEAVLAAVLITIALGILLRRLTILIWTTQQFYPGASFGWRNPPVHLARGVQISSASAALVCLTAVVYLGLLVFLRFTRGGVGVVERAPRRRRECFSVPGVGAGAPPVSAGGGAWRTDRGGGRDRRHS